MESKFLGKICVNTEKKERKKKILIDIGLTLIVLAIVIAVSIGNFISLSLIIPLMYLGYVRKTLVGKTFYKDVFIIVHYDTEISIIIPNSIYFRSMICDRVYRLGKNAGAFFEYDRESGKVEIRGKNILEISNNNKILKQGICDSVTFWLDADDAISLYKILCEHD